MDSKSERRRIGEFLRRTEIAILVTLDSANDHAGRPKLPLWLRNDPHMYFLTHRDSRKVTPDLRWGTLNTITDCILNDHEPEPSGEEGTTIHRLPRNWPRDYSSGAVDEKWTEQDLWMNR